MILENYKKEEVNVEKVVDNMGEEIFDEANMTMDDFMSEMGIEKGEKRKKTALDYCYDDGIPIDPEYDVIYLKELSKDDIRDGKAYLSKIHTVESEYDGEKTIRNEAYFVIIDDYNLEVYIIPLNIKDKNIVDLDGEVVGNIHYMSQLFQLVRGVAYLRTGIKNVFEGDENIGRINLGFIRKYLISEPRIEIKIVEKKMKQKNGENSFFNSFVFLKEGDL